MDKLILTLLIVLSYVACVFGGECCKSYTDIIGDEHDSQWCSDYCCYDPKTIGLTYYCCDNILLRAAEDMIDDVCVSWLGEHIYVPVLSGIGFIAICILLCCCCCCCRRNRTQGVIVQGGGGPSMVVVSQQQQQQQQQQHSMRPMDPYRMGYDQ